MTDLIDKKKVITTFRGPEVEALSRVTHSMGEPSEQEAIRTLVKREYNKRFTVPAYKQPSAGNRNETIAERRNRLEALTDEELTAELNTLGALEPYKNGAQDIVYITKDEIGRRIMRVDGPNGGGDTPLSMFLNQLAKQKII